MCAVCKRISCILVILIMLISGIGCVDHTVDSFSACTGLDDNFRLIDVDESCVLGTDVCTFEMLSVRSASAISYVQRRSISGKNASFFSVICLPAVFPAFPGILFAAYALGVCKPDGHAVILNYIHRKDGKK